MRPIKLELEGFTSFRQRSELDFSELDLFAITGPTGAGKSSLLDAITFALFGRTARLGKVGAGRELVSQGAAGMSVCLEFQAGSQVYKVYRGQKGKTPKGQLEKKAASGEWISETGAIREIDALIEDIVGLDFEGFTRAVILPQGKFDEFLRGEKEQRRDVLKDLLGLQIFEKMMQAANSKSQRFAGEARTLESQIEADVTEETRKELERAISVLQQKEADQKGWIARLEEAQTIAQTLAEHRIKQQAHCRDLKAAEEECRKQQSKVENLDVLLQEKRRALEEIETAISALAYDHEEHRRLTGLIPQVKRAAALKTEIAEIENKRAQHESALQDNSGKLEKAHAALGQAVMASRKEEEKLQAAKQALEEMLQRYGLPQAVRGFGPEIEAAAAKESELAGLQTEIRELQTTLSSREKVLTDLESARSQAEAAKAKAEQHLEQLQHKHSAIELRRELHPGEPCPVCEQTVKKAPALVAVADVDAAKDALKQAQKKFDKANQEFLTAPANFEMAEKEIAHKSKSLKVLLDSISLVHEKVRALLGAEPGPDTLNKLEKLAASIEQAQKQAASLEKQWAATRDAESERRNHVELLNQQCANLRERLEETVQQVQQKQKELAGLEQSLVDAPDLKVLEQQFKALEQAKEEKYNLEKRREEARSTLEQTKRDSADASGRLENETKRAAQAKSDLEQAAKQAQKTESQLREAVAPVELPGGRELETLRGELKAANDLLRDAESDRRTTQARLAAVEDKLKKNTELREQCKQLKQSAAVYGDMGTLLNATHFQDYMLQSSYRLLAREGSRYFEELTGGRYSFHSEKDDFAVRDHSNGDELRSVSTLSGGESFLASLSLALALAQSIVELSGERGKAALESLFLDEGFSTLDPETLGKVADALPALQKKGRLIGVITHVESLAEQLPARIEIAKTPTGSRIIQPNGLFKVAEMRA